MSRDRDVSERDDVPVGGAKRAGSRRGSRILKLALLGGVVAVLISDDLRNQLLDMLFGAEEEFDYSSLTEPPEPAAPPDAPSEPFVHSPAEPGDDTGPAPMDATVAEPDEAAPAQPSEVDAGAVSYASYGAPEAGTDESSEPGEVDAGAVRYADYGAPEVGTDESSEAQRGGSSIAPSPAAWRAAAIEPNADEGTPEEPPPAPPAGWWSPSRPRKGRS